LSFPFTFDPLSYFNRPVNNRKDRIDLCCVSSGSEPASLTCFLERLQTNQKDIHVDYNY